MYSTTATCGNLVARRGFLPRVTEEVVVSRTILLVAGFSVLLLCSTPVWAQDCISEVTVIYGGSSGIQPPAGYTKIPVDLNQGAGGDYIYLCYKKGVGAPVTAVAITLGNAAPPTDAVYTRINVDLNRNAGGDYIWLWYTEDPGCTTIHNFQILVNTTTPPSGYTTIPVDLNRNAGGEYIYLCYEEH
jgi:hypothetical protein